MLLPLLAAFTIVVNEFSTDTPQRVELYNTGTSSVNISGWHIDDNAGTTYYTIPSDHILGAGECATYSSTNFNFNTGSTDKVRLFDNTAPPTGTGAVLVDSYTYTTGANAGMSYQRNPDGTGGFSVSSATFDNFNVTNIPCIAQPTSTPTPTPTNVPPTATPTITPTLIPAAASASGPTPTVAIGGSSSVSYDNIYISEFVADPSSGHEWVELYNGNNFAVTLTSWQIDDTADSGSSPKKFTLAIDAYSYETYDLASSILNNTGDTVRLLDSAGTLVDSYTYDEADEDVSWARISVPDGVFCMQDPTKGTANTVCIVSDDPTPKPTSATSSSSTKTTSSKTAKTTTTATAAKKTTGQVLGVSTVRAASVDGFAGVEYTSLVVDSVPTSSANEDSDEALFTSAQNHRTTPWWAFIIPVVAVIFGAAAIGLQVWRIYHEDIDDTFIPLVDYRKKDVNFK